jgi:hypothetical protein
MKQEAAMKREAVSMHSLSSEAAARERGLKLLFMSVLASMCAFAGCNRGPAMSQVSGTVLFPDGSVPKGGVCVVQFQPAAGTTAEVSKGASGAIQPDGTFEMWTKRPGDGVYHGDYVVTFAIFKGAMDMTPMISAKYTRPDTSPYKVTVDDDLEDLKFEVEPLPGAPRS